MDFQSRFEGKTAYMNKMGNIIDPANQNNNMVLQKSNTNAGPEQPPNLFGMDNDDTKKSDLTGVFETGKFTEFPQGGAPANNVANQKSFSQQMAANKSNYKPAPMDSTFSPAKQLQSTNVSPHGKIGLKQQFREEIQDSKTPGVRKIKLKPPTAEDGYTPTIIARIKPKKELTNAADVTFSGGGKQKILAGNNQPSIQVKASAPPSKWDKTAEFGGAQVKSPSNLIQRNNEQRKQTDVKQVMPSPLKKKIDRANTIEATPQYKPNKANEKQTLDNRKGSLPVETSKGQIKDPLSMKDRRHTTAANNNQITPSVSPNKSRRVLPQMSDQHQADNIIQRFKQNQANETNRPLFLQQLNHQQDDGTSEIGTMMSPSSRYGSNSGINQTPIIRRNELQKNAGSNKNLTPGSLVKLQQQYSLHTNNIHPLDVSSLGGASGVFDPNNASHHHQFKRRSVGSDMYSPAFGSASGYTDRRASEVAGNEIRQNSGKDYFSQAVSNSRMGSGIVAPNYPHTPVSIGRNEQTSTTHGFSERSNDYNNPTSRFLVNAGQIPSSAGSHQTQIHVNQNYNTPARNHQNHSVLPLTPVRGRSENNALQLPDRIMKDIPNSSSGMPPQQSTEMGIILSTRQSHMSAQSPSDRFKRNQTFNLESPVRQAPSDQVHQPKVRFHEQDKPEVALSSFTQMQQRHMANQNKNESYQATSSLTVSARQRRAQVIGTDDKDDNVRIKDYIQQNRDENRVGIQKIMPTQDQ